MAKKKKSTHRPSGPKASTVPTQSSKPKTAEDAEAARLKALEAMSDVDLAEAQYDEDGYEIIPVSKGETDEGSYKFVVDGKKYRLPNLQYIDIDLALSLQDLDEFAAFKAIFGRYAPKLVKRIDSDQLLHIGKRWMEHSEFVGEKSGVSLGESKPSPE